MNHLAAILFSACMTSAGIFTCSGCTSVTKPTDERPKFALQLQSSASMTAVRFAHILEQLEAGKAEETKKDVDWWLDQSIMDLGVLEASYPRGQWDEVTVGSDSELKMKTIYKRIAQYRKNHPRQHVIPLEPIQLKLIEAFVEKYQ